MHTHRASHQFLLCVHMEINSVHLVRQGKYILERLLEVIILTLGACGWRVELSKLSLL